MLIRTKKHLLRFSNQKKLATHTRLVWVITLCCVATSLSLDSGSTGFTLLNCQEKTELKPGALASLPAGSMYMQFAVSHLPSPASVSSFVKGGGKFTPHHGWDPSVLRSHYFMKLNEGTEERCWRKFFWPMDAKMLLLTLVLSVCLNHFFFLGLKIRTI